MTEQQEQSDDDNPGYQKVRDNDHPIGELVLTRETFVNHGGMLEHHLYILEGDQVLRAAKWEVYPKGSFDSALCALDEHWEQAKGEFDNMIQDAAGYHDLKSKAPGRQHAMLRGTIAEVGGLLLGQPMSDDRLISGNAGEYTYPLVEISDTMQGVRDTAGSKRLKLGIRFDRYEQKLRDVERILKHTLQKYDKVYMEPMDEGFQSTADDSHDEDWRGDVHKAEEAVFDLSSADDATQTWQEADDVDDIHDAQNDARLEKFEKHVKNFNNFANRVWMSAAMHVSHGKTYSGNDLLITNMREEFSSAKDIYNTMKEQMRDSGLASHELKPFFASVEDKLIPKMQEVISFASRPQHLEEAVRKRLQPNREM